jgi:uncharacterized SAM-binding protein YcdF (DUF218 family)
MEVPPVLTLIKIIEAFILPPGLFIVLLLALALALHRRRQRPLAGATVTIAAIVYALSTQSVANALIDPLESAYPQPAPSQLHGDAIVMLGGGVVLDAPDGDGRGNLLGDSANRLLTTARLYRQLHVPVIISGGPPYTSPYTAGGQSLAEADVAKRQLIELGVPASDIYTDPRSRNTQENAAFTKPILMAHHLQRPILVTSAYHMRRAIMDFQRQDISALPYPTGYLAKHVTGAYDLPWLPSASALSLSATAWKEYIGIAATALGVKG